MANTLTSLEIPTSVVSGVFTNVQEASAFQQASKAVAVAWNGVTTHVLGGNRAKFVAEGEAKPVADPATAVKLLPAKLAVVDIYSNESETAASDAVNALKSQTGADFAKKMDQGISGATDVGTTDRINAISNAPVVEVSDRRTLIQAKSGASSVNAASAWVMSTLLKDELDALTNAAGGILFPSLEANGTLLGLPVYTFTSTEAVGYVGDFANSAAFGIVAPPLHAGGMVRVDPYGTHEGQHMGAENKTAVITELGVAFGVSDASTFRKIVLADAEEEV